MTTLQTSEEGREVARPLRVLTPLIRQDIAEGDRAGMEYYKSAGAKLAEAKEGHFEGDISGFNRWSQREFKRSLTTIRTWMALGSVASSKSFKSREEFERTPKKDGGLGLQRNPVLRRAWGGPVDAVAEKARREAIRLVQDDALTKAQERDAERSLALRLIDIGYKVLAKELHPDKVGGSRDAMKRLNSVRDKLKHSL